MTTKRSCSSFPSSRTARFAGLAAAVLFLAVFAIPAASGQAAEAGDRGGTRLTVGGGASGMKVEYGNRFLVDATGWVDADTIRRIGLEGEVKWIHFFQQSDHVNLATYQGGVRYHFNYGKAQPYVKGLVGMGQFNFPFNYASGNYLVASGGGGVDAIFTRRWSVRTEFEYQYWPEFTYGAMSVYGFTMGVRYRIF
ncbi:MAG TPA: outer membrane beta-barrel protein [Terracidiphilus sp.]|nr:outer membrane beta-barrel protein [Terracidiphilus sp.]